MGRGHGGAAHAAVEATGQGGVNVPAGGGDLRLELQVRRDAPGGKIRHLAAVGVLELSDIAPAEGDALVRGCQHRFAVCLADEDGGNAAVGRHVHEVALDVVVDDDGLGTGVFGVLLLLCKAQDLAGFFSGPLDERDLAGQRFAGEISRCAHAAGHVLIRAIQTGDLLGGCLRRVAVTDFPVTHQQIGGRGLHVIHAGHGQGRIIGRGGGNGSVVRVGGQGQVGAAGALVGRAVLVARCAHQADARIFDALVHLARFGRGRFGESRRHAETHVDRVRTEHDCVLERRDNIRIIRAAAVVAEDLHDHQLRIRRNARYLPAVRADDTRNMRAVRIAAGYIGIIVVIIIREGDLIALIDRVHIHIAHAERIARQLIGNILLGEFRCVYRVLKRLVAGIETRIEDRDDHTLAGVASILRNVAADGGHTVRELHLVHRLDELVDLGDIGIFDAGQVLDGLQVGVVGFDRQAVEHGRILVPDLYVVQLGGQLALHGLAGPLQLALGGLSGAAVQKVRHAGILGDLVAVQQGGVLQLNDDADSFVRRIGRDLLAAVRLEEGTGVLALHRQGRHGRAQQRSGQQTSAPAPE